MRRARASDSAASTARDWLQRSLIDPPGNEGIAHAELIVRKRTAVWILYVTLERRPKPPVSELITDLKGFATKQKARIGAG